MNNEELIKENILLKEELEKTKNELIETKEHLKKYTAPIRNKIYYEENKEKEANRRKEKYFKDVIKSREKSKLWNKNNSEKLSELRKLNIDKKKEYDKQYRIINKEKINYNTTLTTEKKKEYARRAYLNKKAKLEKEKLENQNI